MSGSNSNDEQALPPGQRVSATFPRFGLTPYAARFPKDPDTIALRVFGLVETETVIGPALSGLPRVERVADFHCVTTWTCRSLQWSGFLFRDCFESLISAEAKPDRNATEVLLRGQDGYRSSLPLADLLADDVLLADRLDGEPLTVEHGAPLRLIAPAHYGYKSVKHLSGLEFMLPGATYRPAAYRWLDHPRARVAREERGQWAPSWLLRYLFRPLIPSTARRFEEAMRQYRERDKAEWP